MSRWHWAATLVCGPANPKQSRASPFGAYLRGSQAGVSLSSCGTFGFGGATATATSAARRTRSWMKYLPRKQEDSSSPGVPCGSTLWRKRCLPALRGKTVVSYCRIRTDRTRSKTTKTTVE
jgi:hypothetical protein